VIAVLLRDLRPRLLGVALAAWVLYLLEPAFHQHTEPGEPLTPEELAVRALDLGPRGIAATLSYLSALAAIILLAGFVSTDRRRGYAQLYFSHPTRPLAFYALRWALAVTLAFAVSAVFLVLGQLVAWGEFRGGGSGLWLALLSALVWGGVMAFLSTALPRGEAWVAGVMLVPTFYPALLAYLQRGINPGGYQLLLFLLPPQWAFQDVYEWILRGAPAWGSAAYAAGYGVFWLGLAGVLLKLREWGGE
jgi:hypothetical protein